MTHIKTYTKEDGTVVPAHEDHRAPAKPPGKIIKLLESALPEKYKHLANPNHKPAPPPQAKPEPKISSPQSKWAPVAPGPGKPGKGPDKGPTTDKPKSIHAGAMIHPNLDEHGQPVVIHTPDKATGPETWTDPKAWACFTPGGEVPADLNGVPFSRWLDHPTDPDEWDDVEGQDHTIDEPPLPENPKAQAAGVVIEEPDGRVWVIHPTNRFGGYKRTFPKGHLDKGIDLQASAIKEAYEESGLKVQIVDYLCDVVRTTTVARYYLAKRVGGTPTDPGWESQAVSLVPKDRLYTALNMPTDHGVAELIGAGPKPKQPEPKEWPKGLKGTPGLEQTPWF